MEALAVLFALGAASAALVAPVLALIALSRTGRLGRDLDETRRDLAALEARVRATAVLHRATAAADASPVSSAPATPAAVAPQAPPPVLVTPSVSAPVSGRVPEPVPAPAPDQTPAPRPVPPESAAPAARPARRPAAPAPSADFATNLGPKLLVAAGGLAVVVFLGFFVRYAWENNWVGPAGRVLSSAVFSLGLVAGGLRMMGREYRPLGQGLAAAGLSGLYVTAFAAHTVYALVPRAGAAAFMVVITACAVALADRLDARLLAVLAWVGGYLAPVLLSTGEDRAASLFAYLLLLGAGAVWLDRRQPWSETLPLALGGSAFLYAAWYAEHFRPERFPVAAAGLVLLTALFALGSATKERPVSLGLVALLATLGLSVLAAGANRPEVVLPLCLLLAAALLRVQVGARSTLALLAPLPLGIPLLCWAASHYRPEAFGIVAAWLVAGALLLALVPDAAQAAAGTGSRLPDAFLPAVAVLGGGVASIGFASVTDRPLALLGLLAAQAGLAVLVARRWSWAEAAGATLGAVAVLAWHERYFKAERGSEALALALTLAGLYFLVTIVRGLVLRQPLRLAGALTHAVVAGLAWTIVYRVLNVTAPSLLGPAAVALGALHLVVGLAARGREDDTLRARVALGLAAGFLTLAIPVQLGLHGITLAWAVEGVVLLWLGVRQASWLGRAFGYAVLALAIFRLFYRHLPLHPAAFAPVWNPAFGAWLAVIAALAAAYGLVRGLAAHPLDDAARAILGPVALSLLFAVLTMETQSAFDQAARAAVVANDAAAAQSAALQGDLAVSVLWTAFATGLLAGGLAARSRGLFYAAYALFAITAGKLVLVDLATLPTLYRMLSFLALGVLLLAGAWLNLRFRERLTEPPEASS